MMNVLSITIAKSFIDAYVSVTIQLPSSVQYYGTNERRAYCTEDGSWMVTETYASIKDLAIVYNRENIHHNPT